MRIRRTAAAAENLQQIKDHLTENHPEFAESVILEIYEAVQSLKALPRRESWACDDSLEEKALG